MYNTNQSSCHFINGALAIGIMKKGHERYMIDVPRNKIEVNLNACDEYITKDR